MFARSVSFEHYCKSLADWMTTNRGKDLQNLLKRSALQAIFRQQSIRWQNCAQHYAYEYGSAVSLFVKEAIGHIAGEHTGRKLQSKYADPALEAKKNRLGEKVDELLWPYQRCHLLTNDPRWTAGTRSCRPINPEAGALSPNPAARWLTLAAQRSYGAKEMVAADAMDRAEVFYEVSTTSPWNASFR